MMLITKSAARLTASIFGILSGLGGLTHGIGEVLQGNVATNGIGIYSWAQGPIATNMGGEPGITLVPNFLLTGILTIIVSLTIILWSIIFIDRVNGGRMLILLSFFMLLVGGGVGPPIIGMLAGVAGRGITGPLDWWRQRLPLRLIRFFSNIWAWIFGLAVINGVFLVIGSLVLIYFFDLNNPDLFTTSFFFSFLLQLLLIPAARAYDLEKGRG